MAEQEQKKSSDLDLVFCCDCTSSMSSYIETAKQNIRKISEEMHSMEKMNIQYGLVCYRDHPPQDNSYATKVFPLTPKIQEMQNNVSTMSAQGGGDGPESVSCALRDVLNLDYRKDSVRVCVLIADAPPHGIGESGDGFPNGCPCGVDPIQIARKMEENKIVIYMVACEPSLSNYKNATAFFKGIADITHGRYLALGSAHLLPKVIVGGSAEELDMKKVEQEVLKETEKVAAELGTKADADTIEKKVMANLHSKGVNTWQLDVTHQTDNITNADVYFKSPTLASAQASIKPPVAPQTYSSFGASYAFPAPPGAPYSAPPGAYGAPPSAYGAPPSAYGAPPSDYGASGFSFSSAPHPSSAHGGFSFGASPSFAPSPSPSYASQAACVNKSPISQQQIQKVLQKNNYNYTKPS